VSAGKRSQATRKKTSISVAIASPPQKEYFKNWMPEWFLSNRIFFESTIRISYSNSKELANSNRQKTI
jgi:hypothetical protein